MKFLATLLFALLLMADAYTQESILLPAADTVGGMPLMQALKIRQTHRDFNGPDITDQQLSNLLWAADGINRPETGKRTAPSAMNFQEIDIYVVLQKGVYHYDPFKHRLEWITGDDIRAQTGIQDFVAAAPVNLVFVADMAKMGKSDVSTRDLYAMADAAYISQNVYLFCASEGLHTGVRAYIDKENLSKALKLRQDQKIMLAQSVGFPKK